MKCHPPPLPVQTPEPVRVRSRRRNYSEHLEVKWNQESKHLMRQSWEQEEKKENNNYFSRPPRRRGGNFSGSETFPSAVWLLKEIPSSPHSNWEMGCALPRHKCFHILFKSHLPRLVPPSSTSASSSRLLRGDELGRGKKKREKKEKKPDSARSLACL